MKPETVNPETQEPEEEKNLKDYLFEIEGSPTKQQVEDWKNEHGEVFCSGFSPVELFVFRPIGRSEWAQWQATAQEIDPLEAELKLIEICLLWASPAATKSIEKKAGTTATLQEQILQNSNFVNPAMASALVVKL